MLNDTQQRHEAINPDKSFIVQAPAGSGKTELLTQRYLKLLSLVSAPEQIIAITFTRKAANEMRERIIIALQDAQENTPITSEHQQATRNLAQAALAHSLKMQWQLLEQTSRFKIMTIDSLCQSLTRSIPILEKQIPYANICDQPQKYYQQAARDCLHYAEKEPKYQNVLKTLLLHVDNRHDYLIELFSDLLSKRDQWLYLVYSSKDQNKNVCEEGLFSILEHEITRFKQIIPLEIYKNLYSCVRQLCKYTSATKPYEVIENWDNPEDLNSEILQELGNILLTSQGSLRKQFDHHVGLKKGICSTEVLNYLKNSSKELLQTLEQIPQFQETLQKLRNLPAPNYDDEQWVILQSLFSLLPLLVAHLQVIFLEKNEVDFIAVTEQTLLALGNENDPTDLTLFLDHTIKHLLIDEFQDTSIQQFKLLTGLVTGWQPNDQRTVFIVGDPMQSIYRFRSAEVGLFLRAKNQGLGNIKLNSLELTSNFRSDPSLIQWVNNHFKNIFPNKADIESGAIPFHPSKPVKNSISDSFIKAFECKNKEEEAKDIVELIRQQLDTHPDDNIAILVRSRNQLPFIIQQLRAQKISFQGIEIDLLAHLPHLRDIWILTQALLMPANRLVWLAFLRSPWAGLNLKDILKIANFSKNESIYKALGNLNQINNLSEEGYIRAKYIFKVFNKSLSERSQFPLVMWIENTLKQLHVNQILDQHQQNDLEQFWLLLEKFEECGQIADLKNFQREFNKLYSQQVTPSRLQIMTIHKSKGLEFDSVILPGLGSKSLNRDRPLFRWLKIPSQQEDLFLFSPIKASHQEECKLYSYLGILDNEKSFYETQRLLYVAVTRAKKRLFLFDYQEKINKNSFRDLLHTQTFLPPQQKDSSNTETALPKRIYLPIEFYFNKDKNISDNFTNEKFNLSSNIESRITGIIIHELLQWICTYHPPSINDVPWELANQQLEIHGFTESEKNSLKILIKNQIGGIFSSKIGQWIIKKHNQEHNEYEIVVKEQGIFTTKIIDRTFNEHGKQWIIDFKTGMEAEETIAQNKSQLNNYANSLAKLINIPINLGLYYLASNHWVAWEYENECVS